MVQMLSACEKQVTQIQEFSVEVTLLKYKCFF